ncbi:hypothetical protein [Methanosarcina barkeri]|uniref:Uncharacterized protein n=1 Tax=Methanosarcina barkeri 227 TaxID=1434106 RepID=A0A0E3R696_METBA|nr:hypothetical protein [Methanosarcina barkeri]AKB59210.1 hypothetical protein MSBR2_2694 [Methanosarcina barkeri 227]
MTLEIDPYDFLINMKWLPSCGEVKLNPYPQGAKVNVITKGIIVTDTEGHLINHSPELTQTVCNFIYNVWENRVVPDLKIKKESGIPVPFPILSFTVLFDRINKKNIVLYNNECAFNSLALIRPFTHIEKGQDIKFDHICDIKKIKPPLIDNHPVAFFMYKQYGKQVSIYFDFTPNNPNFSESGWEEEEVWLANAYLETILASSFGHLSILIPKLRTYDIPFTIGPKSEKIKKICEIVGKAKNIDDADTMLSNILTFDDVSLLEKNWINLKSFQKRKELLQDAFKCFKYGIHSGVVTILMPQVEGIITEELYSSRNKVPYKWESRVYEFENLIKSEKVGPLTLKILDSLVSFLKDSNLYKKFKWTKEDMSINRNATLHGRDCSFDTCANSIRMILLLDSIYWIFCTLENARSVHTT